LSVTRLTVEDAAATCIAPDLAPRADTDGGPAIPGFELLGELGRGGMGVVYRARQTALKRVVALKVILAGSHASPEQRSRFRAEAEAVARLQHPHIVQVFEVGEHEGRPFFSLEFVDGGSLAQQLDGAPLPPREAAALIETLAGAIHHAHQHDIVHRDLKPANILLDLLPAEPGMGKGESTPAVRRPKITDFGLVTRKSSIDR